MKPPPTTTAKSVDAATAQGMRDEIDRLSIVLDDIEKSINVLLQRTEKLTELRTAATDLAHAHKSFRHALMSVMTMQDRIIDGDLAPNKAGRA